MVNLNRETQIDRKADSPQKIIYLSVQNICTYPFSKITHHLITSTKHQKNCVLESAFTYNPKSTILNCFLATFKQYSFWIF